MRFMMPAFIVADIMYGLRSATPIFHIMCDTSNAEMEEYKLSKFTLFTPGQINALRRYYEYYVKENGEDDAFIEGRIPFFDIK